MDNLKPVTRTEMFLDQIAKNTAGGGGGGGSGSGILVVHRDESDILDKTWQEIVDAGVSVLIPSYQDEGDVLVVNYIALAYIEDGKYGVVYSLPGGSSNLYLTDSANGYPKMPD